MILQSKMNRPDFTDSLKVNYKEAREFIKVLPFDSWILFEQIPDKIKYPLIDLIDSGIRPDLSTAIDETATMFLITKRNVIDSQIEGRQIDLKNVFGIYYCKKDNEFKIA